MMSIFRRHTTITFFLCFLLILLIIEYFGPSTPRASMQAAMPALRSNSVAATNQGHVTELVLDMSGSMAGNDPNKVRCSAADTYISLNHTGEYVGLIGLVNNNGKTDSVGFQTAEIWSPPIEMTYNNRQLLEQIISTKCNPTNDTPTYDALDQAYKQLSTMIGTSGMKGSALLLTDGEPDPDTDAQIGAIEGTLVPRFRGAGWPIDTVAIGTTETNFSFLQTVATQTSGKYYNESQGKVATALNLMPLFVDIFQHEVGRTPGPNLPQTTLGDRVSTQQFTVNPYANSLDIIVVYDTPGTNVVLQDPQGNKVPPVPIVTSTTTPQYEAIFSIDHPISTSNVASLVPWTLTVSGSGNYLMDSLLTSSLEITIHTPTEAFLPLGQMITVIASVDNPDHTPYQGQFTVIGKLSYIGGSLSYPPEPLTFSASNNQYRATTTIPLIAPSGEYQLDVSATQISSDNQISAATQRFRLDNFAYPSLRSLDGSLTTGTATTNVLIWPSWLHFYSLPVLQWISGGPLQGHPVQAEAEISGVLKTLDGSPYTKNAIVTAQVTNASTKAQFSSPVINDGNGSFHFAFPASSAGDYQVQLSSLGSPEDSHGDMLITTQIVSVNLQNVAFNQVVIAAIITAIYLLCLLLYLGYLRFCLLPTPFGAWELESSADGTSGKHSQFKNARRSWLQAYLARNVLSSQQAKLGHSGLQIRFGHHNSIMVRSIERGNRRWLNGSNQPLSDRYSETRQVRYKNSSTNTSDDGINKTYRIIPDISRNSRSQGCFLGITLGIVALGIFLVGLFSHNPVLILLGLCTVPLAVSQGLPALLSMPAQRKPARGSSGRRNTSKRHTTQTTRQKTGKKR